MTVERIIHKNQEDSDTNLLRKQLLLEYCFISTHADETVDAYFHFVPGDISMVILVAGSVLVQQICIFLKVL